MPLWGATTEDEAKPRFLTTVKKRDVYADTTGWTQPAQGTDDPNAQREVLVAIRGLSSRDSSSDAGGTGLAEATLTSMNWNQTSYAWSAGGSISLTVNFNEKVNVVTTGGTPSIMLETTGMMGGVECIYDSGTGTNRLTFLSEDYDPEPEAVEVGDILSVGGYAINVNGGSIRDAGMTSGHSDTIHMVDTGAITTAVGTLTVV